MTKRCKVCQIVLPLEQFAKNQYNKAGEVIRRSECKDCRKNKKPISNRRKINYEEFHPRPEIGDSFHCPICQRTLIIEKSRYINLDHNHHTGEIRGYLCNDCNTGLGKFKDDPKIIERAIQWIKGTINTIAMCY